MTPGDIKILLLAGAAFAVLVVLPLLEMLRRRALQREHDHIDALRVQLAAQSLLATIVEASDDAIVGKDADGFITSWNGGAQRLFGHSAKEVLGRRCLMLFSQEAQAVEAGIVEKIRRGGRLKNFETTMVRKDGQPVAVSLTVSPILDGAGRIAGASAIIRDVTSQKESEASVERLNRELQSRVDELQTVLDVVPVAIAIAYDPGCRNIRMNRAGGEMLGLGPGVNASKSADPDGLLPFKVLREGRELAPDELPMQWAVRHATPVREFETQVLRRDGRSLTLYEYASPLFDAAGRVRGCVGVFVDITERKRAEEALREADRRKDEFLAMLAHELRNPLAPIRNAVQVMQGLRPAEPGLQWGLQVVDRQVAQMARLLDDLLDMARIMRGKVALKLQRLALAEVVGRAAEASLPLFQARGQRFDVALPAEPLWLEGDLARLSQVLSNLLNNAAKYTGDGGRVALSAGREAGFAVVRVRDDGVGIAKEVLPTVFDLFAQADHSLAHAQGGLGLGLPLARQLAEMHGGTVEGASEGLGRGSEFTLRLPLSEAPAAAGPPEGRPPAAPPLRILVVDDYADTAETLAAWLGLSGHSVRSAGSGAAALAAAADFSPQVVLLDIGLPDIDGYEVARRLRGMPGLGGAVLVALTGYGQDEDLRRSREAGFDRHLLKPVAPGDLSALLAASAAFAAKAPEAG